MNFRHCTVCEKQTAHKRALGIGTIIMAILTLGLWLLVIPFYPTRCIHCGTPKWAAMDATDWWPRAKEGNYREKLADRRVGYTVLAGILLAIIVIGLLTNSLFTSSLSARHPQTTVYPSDQ